MIGNHSLIRGCGRRKPGGIYLETELSPFGKPIEDFLVDPPIPVDGDGWEFFTPIGQHLVQRENIWHIADWVGSEYYPNVLDFVLETEQFGLSRRIASTFDFSKITTKSKILLIHARAFVTNWQHFGELTCPQNLPHHSPEILAQELETDKRCCAGVWWLDVEIEPENGRSPTSSDAVLGGTTQQPRPGDKVLGGQLSESLEERRITRVMPSLSYPAFRRPKRILPQYRRAIFLSLPLTNIAVITDGEATEKNLEKASQSELPVHLKNE